jgi:hypothetical protein
MTLVSRWDQADGNVRFYPLAVDRVDRFTQRLETRRGDRTASGLDLTDRSVFAEPRLVGLRFDIGYFGVLARKTREGKFRLRSGRAMTARAWTRA